MQVTRCDSLRMPVNADKCAVVNRSGFSHSQFPQDGHSIHAASFFPFQRTAFAHDETTPASIRLRRSAAATNRAPNHPRRNNRAPHQETLQSRKLFINNNLRLPPEQPHCPSIARCDCGLAADTEIKIRHPARINLCVSCQCLPKLPQR